MVHPSAPATAPRAHLPSSPVASAASAARELPPRSKAYVNANDIIIYNTILDDHLICFFLLVSFFFSFSDFTPRIPKKASVLKSPLESVASIPLVLRFVARKNPKSEESRKNRKKAEESEFGRRKNARNNKILKLLPSCGKVAASCGKLLPSCGCLFGSGVPQICKSFGSPKPSSYT